MKKFLAKLVGLTHAEQQREMDLASEMSAIGRNPDGGLALRKGRTDKADRALLLHVQERIRELENILGQRRADLSAVNSKNESLRKATDEKKAEKAALEASSPGLLKLRQLRGEILNLRSEITATEGQKRILKPLLLALGKDPDVPFNQPDSADSPHAVDTASREPKIKPVIIRYVGGQKKNEIDEKK